jgi:hypothetical protein
VPPSAPPAYGQPGYQQPAYGQPGYQQPGAYQPPGGYPPPGQYGAAPAGYGPPPPPSGGRNRTALIVSIVALVIVASLVIVAIAAHGSKSKKTASSTTPTGVSTNVPTSLLTASASAPTTSFPSGPSSLPSSSGSAITETVAKGVVAQYVVAINQQDETTAATLICSEALTKWRTAIHASGGDFTVKVTGATYKGSAPATGGLDVMYALDVQDLSSSQTGTSNVTFTIVDENGPKICGEK